MVASIPLPCTAWNRPASARKDPGEATEGSAAAVPSSDRQLLEPSSQRTAALCTGAGSLPLDTGIGTHDHLGTALAPSGSPESLVDPPPPLSGLWRVESCVGAAAEAAGPVPAQPPRAPGVLIPEPAAAGEGPSRPSEGSQIRASPRALAGQWLSRCPFWPHQWHLP